MIKKSTHAIFLNTLVLFFLASQCCISFSQLREWANDLKIENTENLEKNEPEEKEEKKEKEDKWHQSGVNIDLLSSFVTLSRHISFNIYGTYPCDITTPPPKFLS